MTITRINLAGHIPAPLRREIARHVVTFANGYYDDDPAGLTCPVCLRLVRSRAAAQKHAGEHLDNLNIRYTVEEVTR